MAELIKTLRAWFWDNNGEYHGSKKFKKHDSHFKYGKGSYNVDFKASYKEDVPIPFLWRRRTYFYNIKNSNPYTLDKEGKPPISPEVYNIQLETKVARDLNDLSKKGLMDFLTPKNLIVLGIVILIAIYLLSGNKLF